jgi:hypothetical protein
MYTSWWLWAVVRGVVVVLPSHVFVGPTKTGTTWVDSYLRSRSDVLLPIDMKETFFFDKRFSKGLNWYESFFEAGAESGVCVEVAPSLFAKPEAARRLADTLPKAHVICTLRNPVERAVSHYFHYLKCGMPDVGFDRMVAERRDILGSGLYYRNLINWFELLGRERVHVLLHDQMVSDVDGFCRNICTILGIPFQPPGREIAAANINEAGVPRHRLLARLVRTGTDELRGLGAARLVNMFNTGPLKRFVFGSAPDGGRKQDIRRQALRHYDALSPDLDKLEKLLGIDLESWKTLPPLDHSRHAEAKPGLGQAGA